jgi:threonine synthase
VESDRDTVDSSDAVGKAAAKPAGGQKPTGGQKSAGSQKSTGSHVDGPTPQNAWPAARNLLEHYREFLPVTARTPLVSRGEGFTPLVRAHALEERVGCAELWLKQEGCNPTGSFKDRGMVMAVAKALEEGAKAIMCASTGNTSAAAAAYAAASQMKAVVIVSQGQIAMGKLAQALIYGAVVIALEGTFDDALRIVREITARHPITVVNSINPYRLQGQKTAAFECSDVLGDAPDILAIPVGNAGNITSYWMGFREYHRAGRNTCLPRMWGFEAEGAAAIVENRPIEHPDTVASALRIGNPANWQRAVRARDESGGVIATVSDPEILEAYQLLADHEGIFAEPASAASVAGVLKMAAAGEVKSTDRIVCVLTGHGLKDPHIALDVAREVVPVPNDVQEVEKILDLQ